MKKITLILLVLLVASCDGSAPTAIPTQLAVLPCLAQGAAEPRPTVPTSVYSDNGVGAAVCLLLYDG